MQDNEGLALARLAEEQFHTAKILGKSIRDIFAAVSWQPQRLTNLF
jgi:hypothetical protein